MAKDKDVEETTATEATGQPAADGETVREDWVVETHGEPPADSESQYNVIR